MERRALAAELPRTKTVELLSCIGAMYAPTQKPNGTNPEAMIPGLPVQNIPLLAAAAAAAQAGLSSSEHLPDVYLANPAMLWICLAESFNLLAHGSCLMLLAAAISNCKGAQERERE